jgi:D-alanyl-D-alanine carboxypeptidase/D-alanyl-D-alanine-endopeptidase (penicillin-binding protein 4)
MRRLVLVAVAALVLAAPASAANAAPLAQRLARAIVVPSVALTSTGAVAIDLTTGRTLFAQNPDLSLAPASNEKLPVSYAALRELGPSYRFRTDVIGSGHQEGAVWRGNLVLKGYGDPTLTSAGLGKLAAELKAEGIRKVSGRVLGDESWFDGVRTAPGWKASFYLEESPPLSALVVDHDVYERHLALEPALAAAGRFKQVLRAHGIVVDGPVGTGVAAETGLSIAEVVSKPLVDVLRFMDRQSDNFTAELLLKTLGAEAGAGGTTAAGAAVVRHDLAAAGIPLAGVRIVDGSGLSGFDRLTARAVTALLADVWRDPALRRALWGALPVAGRNGTLAHRLRRGPAHGVVRAKTGTTDEASALSGYVGDRYAFAVLQNGRPVSWTWARKAQDRFVTVLAAAA